MDNTDDDIEPGMKVAMGRGFLEHIGTVLRLRGERVMVRRTQPTDWPDELEFGRTVMTLGRKTVGLGGFHERHRLSFATSEHHLPVALFPRRHRDP
jgi:hypothetical protein